MTGRRDDTVRNTLIAAALMEIEASGLAGLSLRSIAATARKSTTAVFHHFGDKGGLLAAAADMALTQEKAFHAARVQSLAGLAVDRNTLIDLVTDYVIERSRGGLSTPGGMRIWHELVFNIALWPEGSSYLERWRDTLADFWQPLLDAAGLQHVPARYLATYLVMEGSYASVLEGDVGYRLLLKETVAAFFCAPMDQPVHSVTSWHDAQATAPTRANVPADESLGSRLLEVAAQEILDKGVTALNHRNLTAKAGASPAMIVYHFGDKATLESAAIWRALLVGLPDYLNLSVRHPQGRQTFSQWLEAVGKTVLPSTLGVPGFYVGYARIVGQTCIMARRDAALVPLVQYLRAMEGVGTFNAGQTIWPIAMRLPRSKATGFAIWVKGFAMLNEAIGAASTEAVLAELAGMAGTLAPNPPPR